MRWQEEGPWMKAFFMLVSPLAAAKPTAMEIKMMKTTTLSWHGDPFFAPESARPCLGSECTAHPLSEDDPEEIVTGIASRGKRGVFQGSPDHAASSDRMTCKITHGPGDLNAVVVLDPDRGGNAATEIDPRVADEQFAGELIDQSCGDRRISLDIRIVVDMARQRISGTPGAHAPIKSAQWKPRVGRHAVGDARHLRDRIGEQ